MPATSPPDLSPDHPPARPRPLSRPVSGPHQLRLLPHLAATAQARPPSSSAPHRCQKLPLPRGPHPHRPVLRRSRDAHVAERSIQQPLRLKETRLNALVVSPIGLDQLRSTTGRQAQQAPLKDAPPRPAQHMDRVQPDLLAMRSLRAPERNEVLTNAVINSHTKHRPTQSHSRR